MNVSDTALLVAAGIAAAGALVSLAVDAGRTMRKLRAQEKEHLRLVYARLDQSLDENEAAGAQSPGDRALLKRIELLSAQVRQLEARMPEGATLDMLASVNDAILATKLEALEKQLDRVEREQIGPGKVTVIVFGVLAAFFGLAALLPWIVDRVAG